tara:strand:- start:200 stop:892 length:693 start_codon:yes stop_codon:yes gene_type:complete
MAYEASRIALKYMIPVMLLTDGYIANGSEPWKIPSLDTINKIEHNIITKNSNFSPFDHNNKNLARPWALPGTPGLEHRVGGLEKWDKSGNVSYDPENHQHMVNLRQKKVDVIAKDIPKSKLFGKNQGDILVLGWGGTHGAIRSAVEMAQEQGFSVSHLHLRYINPLPIDLNEIIVKFKKILIPELNLGQLAMIIRSKYLIDAISINKIEGKPLSKLEIYNQINKIIKEVN